MTTAFALLAAFALGFCAATWRSLRTHCRLRAELHAAAAQSDALRDSNAQLRDALRAADAQCAANAAQIWALAATLDAEAARGAQGVAPVRVGDDVMQRFCWN